MINNDLELRGFWLGRWFQAATEEQRSQAIGDVLRLIARGEIKVEIDSRFPIEQIRAAVVRAATPGRSGKVLLTPTSS